MAITNFNGTAVAKAIQENLNKGHCYAEKLNHDYEGDIKAYGDTVKILSIGRITVKNYTRNSGAGGTAASPTIAGIDRPEVLLDSAMFLTIDQAKYFNFEIDDVDKWQARPELMGKAVKEASYAMLDAVDLYVGSTLQTGVAGTTNGTGNRLPAKNIGTQSGDDDAYETLVDLKVKLKENNIPDHDLWVVVPPWFMGMLEKDVRFTNYGTPANRASLENGLKGRAAGFDICESNNISGPTAGTLAISGGAYTIIAGTRNAATFAEQIDKVEAFRPPDGFMDAMKGLHLYGAKVTRPEGLASVAVTPA